MVNEEGKVVSVSEMREMKIQAKIREDIDKLVLELSKI